MNATNTSRVDSTGTAPLCEAGTNEFLTSDAEWSRRARRDMESLPLEPFWVCGWRDVVFLHLETDPDLLQSVVPFALDLHEGRAFVSLVAFTLSEMRPRLGGWLTRALIRPFGTHRFLNVRTYVKHHDQRGIYFLTEYLDAPKLNHLMGPLLYGLPFRVGRLKYQHQPEKNRLSGTVVAETGTLHYQGELREPTALEDRQRDAFLLERYRAFTERDGRKGWFPVWHSPWRYQPVDARLRETSLLRSTGKWSAKAELVSAHFSAGSDDVWMGLRQRLK